MVYIRTIALGLLLSDGFYLYGKGSAVYRLFCQFWSNLAEMMGAQPNPAAAQDPVGFIIFCLGFGLLVAALLLPNCISALTTLAAGTHTHGDRIKHNVNEAHSAALSPIKTDVAAPCEDSRLAQKTLR